MNEEFKFRVLTKEDWGKGTRDRLRIREDEGLELEDLDGSYTSEPLDSGISGCCWHRIVLDADIPGNSTLTFFFYTSEKEEAAKNWSGTIVFKNVKDALVQVQPGRYITVKIDLHREGEESPVLRQVRIYYPRLSYLRYLPAVYREDSASKEFLERFLSIFESELYDREETISRIPMYFDPMATPKDFVPWLADWLSQDLYELLGDKNREFILRATEFYKQKGTASGIAALISFLTGKKCCVKEYMNNIFRTCGMEYDEGEEIVDEQGCRKFYRKMSRTVDTANPTLLADMSTYSDEVHYVIDTSDKGRYSRRVIGLFIFLPPGKELIKEEELHKIIKSFLPVFVRAEINIVEEIDEVYCISGIIEECESYVHGFLEEEKIKDVLGEYKDSVNWNWLYTYKDAYKGHANDLQCRTPHSKIDVESTL